MKPIVAYLTSIHLIIGFVYLERMVKFSRKSNLREVELVWMTQIVKAK